MTSTLSREKIVDDVYSEIAGVAEPGDLVFYITQYPFKTLKDETRDKTWSSGVRVKMRRWWRPWTGLERDDLDKWHVGIYIASRKRKHHRRINLWAIHSTPGEGVHFEQITPRRFTNLRINNLEERNRLEILRFSGINEEQRGKIVHFTRSKLGAEFDSSKWRNIMLPYVFGVPDIWHDRAQFSCQQLALCSYAAAGINFPHPSRFFPVFNIGRHLGHPLGHPKDWVDPMFPYLMDHHIYRDSRLCLKAAVYQDKKTNEIKIEKGNLRKWAWDEAKRKRYIEKKVIAAGQ